MKLASVPLPVLESPGVRLVTERPRPQVAAVYARNTAQRFYRPELDVLRFCAFSLVFIHHHFPCVPGQYNPNLGKWFAITVSSISAAASYGVDIFFALCAYLITELLLCEKARTGTVDVKSFYLRRTLRIWPLYFFFLALAFATNGLLPAEPVSGTAVAAFLLFSGNWWMMFVRHGVSVINPLWSLSVQEQFYFVWAPLVKKLAERGMLVAAGVMLFVSNFVRLAMFLTHRCSEKYIWFNTFARLDPIALGIIAAVLLRGRAPALSSVRRLFLFVTSFAVLWAAAILLHTWVDEAAVIHFSSVIGYPLVALCSIGIVLSILSSAPPWFAYKPLVYLGRISYGLYVFHLLGLKLADIIGAHASFGTRFVKGQGLLGFFLTVAMAMISYYALEKPFLRMKERFSYVLSRPETRDRQKHLIEPSGIKQFQS
ncbi:MAG TPA: acyltransferase [Terriglobales bacterium]|nr:acyltransferase [Terriglobales bacterium]